MKSFVEKGLLKDRKGRLTELGRVIKTILKKQKERTSVMTDPRLFRDYSE